jgi:hypothetical protein
MLPPCRACELPYGAEQNLTIASFCELTHGCCSCREREHRHSNSEAVKTHSKNAVRDLHLSRDREAADVSLKSTAVAAVAPLTQAEPRFQNIRLG